MFVAPNNAIGQTLYKNLPFNHVRDTTPIAGTMRLTNIMVVPPDLPVKTVADFIAYTKANPGKVTLASSGNGTSVHMSGELFKMMTSLDMVHVPYRGSAGIYPDLMTGKVHVLFDNLPGSIEFVRTGKLKALGVTTAKRNAALPDLPTVAETVPGYEASVFYGVAGPKGIPPEAVEVLNKAFNAALADPKIRQRIKELGGEPTPMTPAAFGKLLPTRPRNGPRWCAPPIFRWSDGALKHCEQKIGRAVYCRAAEAFRSDDAAYFFMCLAKKSVVRFHATSRLSLWKLPRSSQWKPWPPSL